MEQKRIFVGNKIEMRLIRSGRSLINEEQAYSSQFVQWKNQFVAQIAVPMHQGKRIRIRVGDEYLLTFYTPKGLYRCNGIVLEQSVMGQLPTASLKLSSELEKYQRRQFYRMECIIPMQYAVITVEQKKMFHELTESILPERKALIQEQIGHENITYYDGTILDISGGGMRFNSEVRHNEQDILLLHPQLPKDVLKKIPILLGRVISSSPVLYRTNVFDNRIEYIEVTPKERELLICYIFKAEREKRRREMDYKLV